MIAVYNISSLKRRKLLGIPPATSTESEKSGKFVCASFSSDGTCLAAVTDDPEQTMLFYKWEKGKVESRTKLASLTESEVKFIRCSPFVAGIVAVAGSHILKFFQSSESIWRCFGSFSIFVTCLAWLSSEQLLAGSTDGIE